MSASISLSNASMSKHFSRKSKVSKSVAAAEPSNGIQDYRIIFKEIPDYFANVDYTIYTKWDFFIEKIKSFILSNTTLDATIDGKTFVKRVKTFISSLKKRYMDGVFQEFNEAIEYNNTNFLKDQQELLKIVFTSIKENYDLSNNVDNDFVLEHNNKNFYRCSQVLVSEKELKDMAKEREVNIEFKFQNEQAYTNNLAKGKVLISNEDILFTEPCDIFVQRKAFNNDNMNKIDLTRFYVFIKPYQLRDFIFEHYICDNKNNKEKLDINLKVNNEFPLEPKNKVSGSTTNVMCVAYLEPSIYDAFEGVHIPFSGNFQDNDNIWAFIFKKHLEAYNIKVNYVVVGHEHGNINCRCHLQICARLDARTSILFNQGFIYIRHKDEPKIGFKVLFMFTKCKNSKLNATYYCKKAKDFQEIGYINSCFEYVYEIAYFTDGGKEYVHKKLDIDKTIYANKDKDFNEDQVINYLVEGGVKFSHLNVLNVKNLITIIKKGIVNPLPVHLPLELYLTDPELGPKYFDDETSYHIGEMINKWYIENVKDFVVVNNDYRRKALCICGDRGIGKSFLVNQFISDTRYIKKIAGDIPERFMYNGEKLLVLDDVRFSFFIEHKEMCKLLLSSQECTVNSKYNACVWPAGIPVVVLTNDINLLRYFVKSDAFRNCVVSIYAGDVYLGPPNTKEIAMTKVNAEHCIPKAMERMFENQWDEIQRKRVSKYQKFMDGEIKDESKDKKKFVGKKRIYTNTVSDNKVIGGDLEMNLNEEYIELNKDKVRYKGN